MEVWEYYNPGHPLDEEMLRNPTFMKLQGGGLMILQPLLYRPYQQSLNKSNLLVM